MDESITTKKKKSPKPPRSLERIAGEIVVGSSVGFALAYVIALVTAKPFVKESCFGPVEAMAVFVFAFPVVYIITTAGSVYFIGRMGNQTGSFLATVGGVFLGVPVTTLLYLYIGAADYMMLGIEKIILWSLVFLAPPIGATLGFNLTRRYRKPPSP